MEKKDHQQQALKAALSEKTKATGEKVKGLRQEVKQQKMQTEIIIYWNGLTMKVSDSDE